MKAQTSQRHNLPELIPVSLAWSIPRSIATPTWTGCEFIAGLWVFNLSLRRFELYYSGVPFHTICLLLGNSSEVVSKGRYLVFTFSTKREIRHFHVLVEQWRQRNVQKSVMHVQSCYFANLNLLLFWRSRCRRCCRLLKLLSHGLESVWDSGNSPHLPLPLPSVNTKSFES